jgi:transposase
VAVRTTSLRVLQVEGELEALRILTDRREALTRWRIQTVNRLKALLVELLPGQAKAMLAGVRPSDIAARTRRRIAAEELAERVEAEIKKSNAELKAIVLARGSPLMNLHGVSPVMAARVP